MKKENPTLSRIEFINQLILQSNYTIKVQEKIIENAKDLIELEIKRIQNLENQKQSL